MCNLHCNWCDTPYTWDRRRYDVKAECPPMPVTQILERLGQLGADPDPYNRPLIVLSGGEPLIHHHTLPHLLDYRYEWHVESNATIPPPAYWPSLVDHTTLSPKVGQNDDPEGRRLPAKALEAWSGLTRAGGAVAWKFVCRNKGDLQRAQGIVHTYRVPSSAVWIMPEGTSLGQILVGQRALADDVIAAGFNLTTRLHTLVWGEERGR
jgi:organic radical activating enzyme